MSSDATADGLYKLNTADWTMDYSMLVQMQGIGDPYDVTCPAHLIDHPEGTVLFDTGVSYDLVTEPETYGPNGAPQLADLVAAVDMDADQQLDRLLDDAGYAPADVDYLIMSHLHTDHAGNIDLFTDAEIVVHEDELQYAFAPTAPVQELLYTDGDLAPLRDPAYDVRTVTGPFDAFGDGSVVTVPTPGHSPGHQSLRVELPEAGTVVLGADVANHRDGYEAELLPAFTWALDDAVHSIRQVRDLIDRTGADLYLAHDRDDQAALPEPPERLA